MIEKLDKKMEFVEISILGNKKAECLDFEAGRKLNLKINELVDAVNELQLLIKPILEERESEIKVYEEAQDMYNNAILDALKDKKVDVVVEPAENVLTKSLRMDKELAEDECARLQAELERTRKALGVAVDALKWIDETYNLGMEYEAAIMEKCELALKEITALEQKDK